MIQLIVYTGFYWAVKVMESLLVVNSTTACALPSPWISTLWGFGARVKRQGWAQTADAHNLWPSWVSCSLKNHTVPRWGSVPNRGVPLVIKLWGKKGERLWVSTCRQQLWFFLTNIEGLMGERTCTDGGETVTDKLKMYSVYQNSQASIDLFLS